jgi:Domain of unknown function (DUF4359)
MTRILVIVGIVAALLVATNPSRAELNDWAKVFVIKKVEAEARKQGESLNGENAAWGGAIVELLIAHMAIERHNFLVFSIYDIELPPAAQTNNEQYCEILGVGGQFIPVSGC